MEEQNRVMALDRHGRSGDAEIDNEVRDAIRFRLPRGGAFKRDIARSVGISVRSLDRELARRGTCYRDLLYTVRLEIAERELSQGRRALWEVSERLGYSDPANFSRAFRRWTGESPRSYRRRIGAK